MEGGTDGWTDRLTDGATCRVVCTQLKISLVAQDKSILSQAYEPQFDVFVDHLADASASASSFPTIRPCI